MWSPPSNPYPSISHVYPSKLVSEGWLPCLRKILNFTRSNRTLMPECIICSDQLPQHRTLQEIQKQKNNTHWKENNYTNIVSNWKRLFAATTKCWIFKRSPATMFKFISWRSSQSNFWPDGTWNFMCPTRASKVGQSGITACTRPFPLISTRLHAPTWSEVLLDQRAALKQTP